MKHFEVLWYEGTSRDDALCNDPKTLTFRTKRGALAYYNAHKDDPGKYEWWVTKRDNDWLVVEDYVV